MNFAHLFEAAMLVCFGFSWPLNVRKAYKARTAKGTSLTFICLIITGYIAGISAKFINHQLNYVLAVYFLNLAIVSLNVLVYIRNRGLDKKREQEKKHELKFVPVEEAEDVVRAEEKVTELQTAIDYEEQNGVIFLGSGKDGQIPVENLGKSFDFNFKIYNKSVAELGVTNLLNYYNEKIRKLNPEALLIHVGENDLELFKSSSSAFDEALLTFLDEVKLVRHNVRLALVSVKNTAHDRTIAEMNSHIKAIADAENCAFINIDGAKLWNPEATKAASDFAYSMGVRTRKPLKNVAEILFSWAEKELGVEVKDRESFAG